MCNPSGLRNCFCRIADYFSQLNLSTNGCQGHPMFIETDNNRKEKDCMVNNLTIYEPKIS